MKKILFSILILFFWYNLSSSQWVNNTYVPYHAVITDLEVQGTNVYAVAGFGRVFISSNCGDTWVESTQGLPAAGTNAFYDVLTKGNLIYLGGSSGIYKSNNSGLSWQLVSNGINDTVTYLFTDKGSLYAATKGSGIYVSNNDGTSWIQYSFNGIPSGATINTFYRAGNIYYMGLYQYGIYVSTDRGATWHAANNGLIQPPNSNPTTFLKVGNTVFVGLSNSGVYSTSNDGMSWTNKSTGLYANGNYLQDLTKIGNYLAIASSAGPTGAGRGVFISSDNGSNWYAFNEGFSDSSSRNVTALAVCDSNLIAGTNGVGIWTRDISDLSGANNSALKINEENAAVNDKAVTKLNDNYPNPFNPSTVINVNIARTQKVALNIYDAAGRLVTQLANEVKGPGSYNFRFDASGLASGIYYYKLTTDDLVQTKKMLLVK